MLTVLVVEDEPIEREVVVRYLESEGYRTLQAENGDIARDMVATAQPDLVVLDVMLPGMNGLDLCRWINERSGPPVILLTARGEEADRIVGLELGADDYITKPFSPREVVARVKAVLRRSEPLAPASDRLVFDSLVVDAATREVSVAGETVQLTAREFDLLWFLATNPRKVFTRDQLMDRI